MPGDGYARSTQPADRFLSLLHEFHELQQKADAAYETYALAESADADPLGRAREEKEAIWNEATALVAGDPCRHDRGTRGVPRPA
ncbi:MAG: hypothetical protein J2P48_02940 [Alphaproteobacteria bacterium]|nr:hypothetical protein [Alphaproteobacteria bacterium]